MLGTRFACLIVLAELLVACGSQQPAAGTRASLVTGVVAAGPVSPLARPGKPVTRPVPGAAVEALRGSDVVAVTHTDEAGRYELMLHPGTYLIRAESSGLLSRELGKTVTIFAGQRLTVSFILDTGIR
jgi:hypothetical protein